MATQVFSTVLTTAQTLAALDTGVVTSTGTIVAGGPGAIFMNGGSKLQVMGTAIGTEGAGILFVTGSSPTVLIGAGGSVSSLSGSVAAISGVVSGFTTIQNHGQISGAAAININAAAATSVVFIENSGGIEVGGRSFPIAINMVYSGSGLGHLLNTGTISVAGPGKAINLTGTQAFSIVNSGLIVGAINMSTNNDFLTNTGTIIGSIFLGNGNNIFINRGVVTGTVTGGTGSDTYRVFDADIELADAGGLDTVFAACDFRLQSSIEFLQLIGVTGLVGIGNGLANRLTGDVGDDTLRGGDGDDTQQGSDGDNRLFGGRGRDFLFSGQDDELLHGGQDDDSLVFTGGNDTFVGGGGIDAANFSLLSLAAQVNLQTGIATTVLGEQTMLSGVEDLVGSFRDDSMIGNGVANNVQGLPGNDTIAGGNGNDSLDGGDGDDVLVGGGGDDTVQGRSDADIVSGGTGADSFAFFGTGDSDGITATDRITDFVLGQDLIDLSLVDADAAAGLDQAFIFVGSAAFSGVAGEVRAVTDAVTQTTRIEVALAGSTLFSMAIVLDGEMVLGAADFVL